MGGRRVGVCLAVVLLTAGQALAKGPAPAKAQPAAKGRAGATADDGVPALSALAGLGVPFSGATGVEVKVGVKGHVFDFSKLLPGLQLAAVVLVGFGPVTTFEFMPVVEYRRGLPVKHLSLYADLQLGYSHRRRVDAVPFVGYRLSTDNGFIGRLAAGLAYSLGQKFTATLEPLNFGIFAGSAVVPEYSALLGLCYTF